VHFYGGEGSTHFIDLTALTTKGRIHTHRPYGFERFEHALAFLQSPSNLLFKIAGFLLQERCVRKGAADGATLVGGVAGIPGGNWRL
jgi:hypothetical protein